MFSCRRAKSVLFAFCLTLVCLAGGTQSWAQQEDALRIWTDSTGSHKTVATFVELKGSSVSLRRESGEVIQLPLSKLSATDQSFVRRAVRAARESGKPASGEAAATTVASKDWPQWRGPNRDGISQETGLLREWPSEGPPVAFKADGLGSGFSSVAISDGKLFTMGKFEDETRLIALDAATGAELWQTPVDRGGDKPNCTPTVDGELVYALSHGGELICAEVATGRMVWRTNFPRDFGGQMMSMWGYSESPLVDGDNLIVTPGAPNAILAALNKRTGKVVWRTPMPPNPGRAGKDGAAYSSIVISNARGLKQYVQLVGRGVISVEARTGKFLWGYNRVANGTASVPTPIVDGDFVFCSSGYDDGGSALLKVTGSRNQLDVQEVWYKPARELQNHHGGMILIGDHVYMGHGHNNGFPVCFDLKTGQDKWRPGRGPGTGSAAITAADGHLYFRYDNGMMALFEANPNAFVEKGKFRIGINNAQSWPHPVIVSGKLYLRDQHELICYDIREK